MAGGPKEETALLMQLMELKNWKNSQHLVLWTGLPRPLSGGSLAAVRGLVSSLVESEQNPTEASISLHLAATTSAIVATAAISSPSTPPLPLQVVELQYEQPFSPVAPLPFPPLMSDPTFPPQSTRSLGPLLPQPPADEHGEWLIWIPQELKERIVAAAGWPPEHFVKQQGAENKRAKTGDGGNLVNWLLRALCVNYLDPVKTLRDQSHVKVSCVIDLVQAKFPSAHFTVDQVRYAISRRLGRTARKHTKPIGDPASNKVKANHRFKTHKLGTHSVPSLLVAPPSGSLKRPTMSPVVSSDGSAG
jgi:hypothetical protein